MQRISLLRMKENQKGRIIELLGGASFKHKMLSMGLYPGKEITKISHFALRGPVTVKAGRSIIAFGHGVAGKILLKTE